MATQKKKGTSWESVMDIVQRQANNTGQTATVTLTAPPKAPPKQPSYIPTQNTYDTPRARTAAQQRASQGSGRPAGYLAPGQQGPQARPIARAGTGYRFTQAQPALAQAAADKIRGQYAEAQQPGGGAFVTDTNTGLLTLLQQAGLNPTPLEQWGSYLNRLQQQSASALPIQATALNYR